MKIIYGITKSNFGGAQRYVFDLAREARKAGHEVAVMCGGEGVLVDKLKNHGIRVISLPRMQRDISLVDELRSLHFIFRTLFEEKPDVFHTNSSKMGGLGNLAARMAGVRKIIFTGHGWEFNGPRLWWSRLAIKFFVWLTILLSHKTICVSEKTRMDVSSWLFVTKRLAVIRNGIEKFEILPREQARAELGIEPQELVVGALSELRAIKGLDVLLFAWNKFAKKNSNATLLIFGEGEERDELEELAGILEISDSVEFRGYVENARKYLPAFDIFCLPSRSEAMPYTLLEAGFAGVPVVATNVGGIPEIIEASVSGALVEAENPEALFSTLLLFAQDKKLATRLGQNLKETVLHNFSAKKMAEETFKIYSR